MSFKQISKKSTFFKMEVPNTAENERVTYQDNFVLY